MPCDLRSCTGTLEGCPGMAGLLVSFISFLLIDKLFPALSIIWFPRACLLTPCVCTNSDSFRLLPYKHFQVWQECELVADWIY